MLRLPLQSFPLITATPTAMSHAITIESHLPTSKPLTLAAILSALAESGAKPMHIHRFFRAWLGKGEWPKADDERFPKGMRAIVPTLRNKLENVVRIRSRHPGADPESERLLLTLADGQTIESVLLPRKGVCVSTQMGCAVGCVFCMTGQGGLIRQLTDLEIIAEVALARKLRPETKKVVFMGMGEPSHNLEAVMRAVQFLGEHGDFGHKDLVVSTVGDPRLFDALQRSSVRPALAISLHTVDDEKRARLLPKGARMKAEDLICAADAWAKATGYPAQIQWTLIEGVNDMVEEIERLAELLQDRYMMVNFIPVNAVAGSPFKRPDREHAAALVRLLRAKGVIATLRDSAAQDVDGGCGQLRARVLNRSSEPRREEQE